MSELTAGYTTPRLITPHEHGGLARLIRRKWRCTVCGHRLTVMGIPPIETRKMPPRAWIPELIDRRRARA